MEESPRAANGVQSFSIMLNVPVLPSPSDRAVTLNLGVLPRFYGHLVKAHNEPGGCHDTAAEIFSGV